MDKGLFDFVFFTQGTMIVIPLRNIFIQVQYLIIFGSQKDLDILTVLRNYCFFLDVYAVLGTHVPGCIFHPFLPF
jgi:hypothetical protein